MNRPAYQEWVDAKNSGLKGKALLPYRRRMSAEAANLQRVKKREEIKTYIAWLESAVENLRAQGAEPPYFFKLEAYDNKHVEAKSYINHLKKELKSYE